MEEMQQEVHQLKDEHRAAVTLLQNQLQDINTRSDEQSAYIRTLEQELQRQNEALTSLRGSMERDNARVNALDAQTDELRDRLLAVTQTTLRVIDHVRPTAHADTPDGIEGHLPVSLSQSQDRVPSTSIGQPDTSSNGNLAALEESALQGSPEATLNATEPVDQEGITLEGVDLAPKTASPKVARREVSAPFTSFSGAYEKDNELPGPGQRALRRKSALSPVKEDPRVGTPSPLLTTGEIAATDNPTVEPKSASFSSVGLSGPAGTTTLASSSTNNDAAGVGAIAASGQGERPKRKRMTADEKARLAASNLIGDSGSDGDKKRRRTVVAKKVRFVGDNVESRKEGNSGFDGTAIQAATGGFEAAQELKAVEEAKGVKNHARTTSTDGDKAESNDATLYPAGTEQPVLGQAKARVWGGQGKARKPSKERREDMSIIDVPTGLSRKDPKDVDVMEDTIVVARPADMMQPSASSASKSKDGKGGSASQAGTHLDDALGSEDELSLPFDGRQRSKQPNNTVVAIAGSDGADSKMGSSERERQSLLSQFTADKRTAKDVQVKRESDAGPEARPKRQQKPRKFAESL